MNVYRIEVDRIERDGSIFTVIQHRELKVTKSIRGRDRQMNNLVDKVIEELKYYQVPHKRLTVSLV